MEDERLLNIIEALEDLSQDRTVPKNIRAKLGIIATTLKEDSEVSIRIDKALQELDYISDDSNIQAHTRTQVWNLVSMLETI